MATERAPAGRLLLVVGPSGAGKDTLIDGAARRLAGNGRVVFARRLVTRPASAGGEAHIAITPEEFTRLRREGGTLLDWEAHGLGYALPAALAADLAAGRVVVANVSRAVIAAARARFPGTLVVEITAPPEVLAHRLAARGREAVADIAERLRRAASVPVAADAVIVNDGPVDAAVERLVAAIEAALAG